MYLSEWISRSARGLGAQDMRAWALWGVLYLRSMVCIALKYFDLAMARALLHLGWIVIGMLSNGWWEKQPKAMREDIHMKRGIAVILLAIFALATLALPAVLGAQDQNQPTTDQPGRGERPQRPQRPEGERGGRMDMAQIMSQMRERQLDRVKQSLGVTDTEWEAISPLVGAVIDKQAEVTGRRGFGMAGNFGGRGRGGEVAATVVSTLDENAPAETRALAEALDLESTSADDIKAKLAAYRKARQVKEEELKKAREELRSVLTVRQEARLVLQGTLD
jgi:hypothetical protein